MQKSKNYSKKRCNLNLITWVLWGLFVVYMCAATAKSSLSQYQFHHTISYVYWFAANHWVQGKDLYNSSGGGFIYFPQSAILYIPFTLFPFVISEVLLRFCLCVVLAVSLFCFSKLFDRSHVYFLIATIVACMIGFPAIRGGQFNVIVAQTMLLAMWFWYRERYTFATVVLCISVAFKPLILPLVVILFILQKEMRVKLLLGLLIVALFPFLTQHPQYVLKQYHDLPIMLKAVATKGDVQAKQWSQLFTLLWHLGVKVSQTAQNILSLTAALITLLLCVLVFMTKNRRAIAFYFYALIAIFLMLFNTRNELNSFVILGPAVGFALAFYLIQQKIGRVVWLLLTILGLKTSVYWLEPIYALFFFFIILPDMMLVISKNQPLPDQI